MRPYRLPLKFIGLLVLNLAVLLGVSIALDIPEFLSLTLRISIRDLTWIYLLLGGILASLEEWLIDKLQGNE